MKALTQDEAVIHKALENSNISVIDGNRIKANVKQSGRSTIILREIPSDASEDEVREIFAFEGCKHISSMRSDIGDTWFIVMESEDDAKDTLIDLRLKKRLFRGNQVKGRVKSETIVRSFYPMTPAAPTLYPGMPSFPLGAPILGPGPGVPLMPAPMFGYGMVPNASGQMVPAMIPMQAPNLVPPIISAGDLNFNGTMELIDNTGIDAGVGAMQDYAGATGVDPNLDPTADSNGQMVNGVYKSNTNISNNNLKQKGNIGTGGSGGVTNPNQFINTKENSLNTASGTSNMTATNNNMKFPNKKSGPGTANGAAPVGNTNSAGGSGNNVGRKQGSGGVKGNNNFNSKPGASGGAGGYKSHDSHHHKAPPIEISSVNFPPLSGHDESSPVPTAGYTTAYTKYSLDEIINIVRDVNDTKLPESIKVSDHDIVMCESPNVDLLRRQRSRSIEETREHLKQGRPVHREAIAEGHATDYGSMIYGEGYQDASTAHSGGVSTSLSTVVGNEGTAAGNQNTAGTPSSPIFAAQQSTNIPFSKSGSGGGSWAAMLKSTTHLVPVAESPRPAASSSSANNKNSKTNHSSHNNSSSTAKKNTANHTNAASSGTSTSKANTEHVEKTVSSQSNQPSFTNSNTIIDPTATFMTDHTSSSNNSNSNNNIVDNNRPSHTATSAAAAVTGSISSSEMFSFTSMDSSLSFTGGAEHVS